jgi:hypothetical protein
MDQRWLVGGVLAARRPRGAQLGRDPSSHRALNLFGAHFQTARFFKFFTGM